MIKHSNTNKNGSIKMTVSQTFAETGKRSAKPVSQGLEQSKRHKLEDHQARIYSDDWMDELEREERRERAAL